MLNDQAAIVEAEQAKVFTALYTLNKVTLVGCDLVDVKALVVLVGCFGGQCEVGPGIVDR